MKFFSGKYKKKAKELVSSSKILAISSLTIFLDEYPALSKYFVNSKKTSEWDFFLTLAGVHAGLQNFHLSTKSTEFLRYVKSINEELYKINPISVEGFSDLSNFIKRNIENGIKYHTALGLWVIWNIKNAEPSEDEFNIANAIGIYLANSFNDFWHQ